MYHFVGTCWDKKLWQANTVHLYNEDCHELMYSYIEEFNKVIKEYVQKYPDMEDLLTLGVEGYKK